MKLGSYQNKYYHIKRDIGGVHLIVFQKISKILKLDAMFPLH